VSTTPSQWPLSPIAELGRVVTGSTPPSSKPHRFGEAFPFITPTDLKFGVRAPKTSRFLSEDGASSLSKRMLPAGSVCFTCIGATIGKACLVSSPSFTNQQINSVVVDQQRHDPSYVYYLLRQHSGEIRAHAGGAATPILNKSNFGRILLPVAPLCLQRKIGTILSSYDELIENNSRRIEILGELAHEVYHEWFVKFRYPGHEDVPLIHSILGPIPEDWKVSRVEEVAEIVRGRSYRKDEIPESGGVPFLNLKCINRGGGFRKSGLKRYTGPYKPAQAANSGGIVIAVTDMTQERNVVARAARVPSMPEEFGVISLDLVKVAPLTVSSSYLYGMLRYSSFPDEVKNFANGANVLHLHPDRIAEYQFAKAPDDVQLQYSAAVDPIYDLADRLELEVQNLRATRDILQPRLISGELDVSDVAIETGDMAG